MTIYNDIVSFFERNGPSTSNVYYDHIAATSNQSRDASRKRLQRALKAPNPLRSLNTIKFPHDRQFIYLESDRKTPRFIESLFAALSQENSGYAMLLQGINTRGGYISSSDLTVVSGLPVQKRKGHLLVQNSINNLLNEKLIEKHDINGQEFFTLPSSKIALRTNTDTREKYLYQEKIMLELFKTWLRRNGFTSYDKTATRDLYSAPEWGGYAWDLTAPSYLSTIKSFKKNSPTPVPGFAVADIHVCSLNKLQAAYFIKKCDAIKNNPRNMPFIPFLLAISFSPEALQEAKKKGYLYVTIGQFFGENLVDQLYFIHDLLSNPSKIKDLTKAQVKNLIESFKQIGFDEGHLRGDIFELISHHLLQKTYPECIHSQTYRTDKGDKIEIDVVGINDTEIIMVECKGYRTNRMVQLGTLDTQGEILDWTKRRIPRMIEYASYKDTKGNSGRIFHFSFWTTSTFSQEAIDYLTDYKSKSPHKISWIDTHKLKENLAKENLTNLIKVLNEHYKPLKEDRKRQTRIVLPTKLIEAIEKEFNVSKADAGQKMKTIKEAIEKGLLRQDTSVAECIDYLTTS